MYLKLIMFSIVVCFGLPNSAIATVLNCKQVSASEYWVYNHDDWSDSRASANLRDLVITLKDGCFVKTVGLYWADFGGLGLFFGGNFQESQNLFLADTSDSITCRGIKTLGDISLDNDLEKVETAELGLKLVINRLSGSLSVDYDEMWKYTRDRSTYFSLDAQFQCAVAKQLF